MKKNQAKNGEAMIWSSIIFLKTCCPALPFIALSRKVYQAWLIGPCAKPIRNIRPTSVTIKTIHR